jgi:hypothetical protein
MTITLDDKNKVRKIARDSFGELLDLSENDKARLKEALKDNKTLRLVEMVIVAHELEIDDNARGLLKLRAEILQERMGEMMKSAREVKYANQQ